MIMRNDSILIYFIKFTLTYKPLQPVRRRIITMIASTLLQICNTQSARHAHSCLPKQW